MKQLAFVFSFLFLFKVGYTQETPLKINKPSEKQISDYDAWFTKNEERHLNEVKELVSFYSAAMIPTEREDLDAAGDYLKTKLETLGMTNVSIEPANGFPMVIGESITQKDQPTVLFYGHYDVQPADPTRWNTDPFKGEIVDGKMYGRGVTDDKGPIIALLSAMEAITKIDGKLPVNVMFILDGCEEFGSQGMEQWLKENQEWISRADFGINVDAMMQSDDQGLMWKSLRGGGDVEVTLKSANTDLHSGMYGGAAPNAALAASKIIASMFNDDGSIAIEGFNEGTLPLTEITKSEIAEAAKDLKDTYSLEGLEITEWVGDDTYTIYERTTVQPSLDVTGLKSGYIEGKASIVPHSAWFRVLSRTAPGQDVAVINEKIIAHIKKNIPWGIKAEFKDLTAGSAASVSEDNLGFQIGKKVLTDFFGQAPKVAFIGGGVPALSYVPNGGGPDLITFGFQRSDENFHADNEYMRIDSFRKAQRAYAQLIHAFVGQPKRK